MTIQDKWKQALKDRSYLWRKYGSPDNMSGAYVDQDDLELMFEKLSKKTAYDCMKHQIQYWFDDPPLLQGMSGALDIGAARNEDARLEEIAERYFID